MKRVWDSTCPRCGWRMTIEGFSFTLASEVATYGHVCADGMQMPSGQPVERVVPGPGERTRLDEEKGVC
jgi:hypothetical protein